MKQPPTSDVGLEEYRKASPAALLPGRSGGIFGKTYEKKGRIEANLYQFMGCLVHRWGFRGAMDVGCGFTGEIDLQFMEV